MGPPLHRLEDPSANLCSGTLIASLLKGPSESRASLPGHSLPRWAGSLPLLEPPHASVVCRSPIVPPPAQALLRGHFSPRPASSPRLVFATCRLHPAPYQLLQRVPQVSRRLQRLLVRSLFTPMCPAMVRFSGQQMVAPGPRGVLFTPRDHIVLTGSLWG
ncbi:hypothetical protein NDU88_000940 [Pleurodeles waltl]|uniref:Uncharacterized protein n=1 Tax=Pleurodeles waltl TaxID=8319 RepID=A0AAV7NB71_PLEWA|nr:hypothetical protein NDU88_000940 [Pleurodeles waltl]